MENLIPEEVFEIFELYKKENHKIYLVGGSLRDLLSGKSITDYDFTTDALSEESKRILKEAKIIDIGKAFGTIKVFYKGFECEITPFRQESEYDHRRPGNVSFGVSLKEDLKRRDFTINALAWSPEGNIIDYFNGREDLDKKVLRAIGDPEERFKEDALRLLRAIRFASKKGFKIEKKTFLALKKMHLDLQYISKERITEEFIRIISGETPDKGISLLEKSGILEFLFPDSLQEKSFSLDSFKNLPLRLAALLDALYPDLHSQKNHLYSYPYSNKTRTEVLFLLHHRNDSLCENLYAIRKDRCKYGDDSLNTLIEYKEALGEDLFLYKNNLKKTSGDCCSKRDLAIKGGDLIRIGIPKGPSIGTYLDYLLEEVLKDPRKNKKDILLNIAENINLSSNPSE